MEIPLMSSRSSTGVIVALVVFVVLSIALLALSIVLYTGRTAAEQKESEARAELNSNINTEQRGRSDAQAMKANAGAESLYGYMTEQSAQVAQFVTGDRSANLDKMRTDLGVGADDTVRNAMRRVSQERDARTQEANSLKTRVADLGKEIDGLKGQIAAAEKARQDAVAAVTASIASYREAGDGYRGEFDQAMGALEATRADNEARFNSRVAQLESEIDGLRSERSVLFSRIDSLQRKVEATATRAANPATLVDARVVDFDASTGTIFIDIGSNKRVVPGMTFEVFDDAAAIMAAADSESRGKASVQVIKVGESTSTCRIVRGSPSRPVLRDDVLANAVFNPDYRFKFMVHGKFDANGDGRATDAEADYLRSRVVEWGGEVVEAETLAGDIDFLVLGAQPPMPAPLPSDATEAQTLSYTEQRAARELYDSLFRNASDAQIPVLNWTRFEALTGTVNR
jgi:hypothetical protein